MFNNHNNILHNQNQNEFNLYTSTQLRADSGINYQ